MFQKLLQRHLSKGALGRKMLSIDKGAIALASDLGLKRVDNQDRAGVIKFRHTTVSYILLAVVDGMGGMRDGEQSAEIAISTFLSSVLENINLGPEASISRAALDANDAVFALTNGNGGSTLSAILIDSDGEYITVNVGDSRIYAKDSGLNQIIRLSVDDSLAEVVGGSGTELLQFIGMGDGIQPHIAKLTQEVSQVYLTTDGIHYIEPQTLSDIVEHADRVIQVVERLVASARWCGGPDNATICAIDLELFSFEEYLYSDEIIEFSDPFGTTQFAFEISPIKVANSTENHSEKQTSNNLSSSNNSKTVHPEDFSNSDMLKTEKPAVKKNNTEDKDDSTQKKQTKKNKKKKSDEENIQIKMTIFDDADEKTNKEKDDASK